jgi:hypothetical protein
MSCIPICSGFLHNTILPHSNNYTLFIHAHQVLHPDYLVTLLTHIPRIPRLTLHLALMYSPHITIVTSSLRMKVPPHDLWSARTPPTSASPISHPSQPNSVRPRLTNRAPQPILPRGAIHLRDWINAREKQSETAPQGRLWLHVLIRKGGTLCRCRTVLFWGILLFLESRCWKVRGRWLHRDEWKGQG